MENVLMDIKNFLKNLENGQVELEAGQWELNKTLSAMNTAVTNLNTLRDDVEDLRFSSVQQMRLIKELQAQLEKLQNMSQGPMTVSESSVERSRVTGTRPVDSQATTKGFQEKRKCRIRSEEIIHITSRMSNEKSESRSESAPTADEGTEGTVITDYTASANEQNSEESSHSLYKTESYTRLMQSKPDQMSRCPNNDMLQRYLKDSVKYIDRKGSNMTLSTRCTSQRSEEERSQSVENTTFWDEFSSRAPQNSNCEEQIENSLKENSTVTEISNAEKVIPKRFACSQCPKKFMYRIDSVRHETKHRAIEPVFYCKTCGKGFGSREKLKDHKAIHKVSKSFKGFGCSYCGKICNSPEKLTTHLRKCRIIMRSHYKKK